MSEDLTCTNPELQSPLNKASKDRFILVLNLPSVLRDAASTNDCLNIANLQLSVFGALVPQISVPAVELRYASQSTNYSSHSRPNYPPLTVNFVVDNEFKNYYILWKWLAVLNDPREAKYTGTPQKLQKANFSTNAEYQTNLSLLALNEYNQTVAEFVYYNSFITDLGGISYSYRDGEIIETTAEFQYSQLDMIKPKK